MSKIRKYPANVFVDRQQREVAHEAWRIKNSYTQLYYWFVWHNDNEPKLFDVTVQIHDFKLGHALTVAQQARNLWLHKHGHEAPRERVQS